MLKVEELKENPELKQYHLGIIVSSMKLDPWNGSLVGPPTYTVHVYSTFLSPQQTSNPRNLFTNLFVTCNFRMHLIILGALLFRFFNLMLVASL